VTAQITVPEDAEAQWIECHMCEDYWCSVHVLHVFECPCPDYETMLFPEDGSEGVNPYETFE
jgi:hypothetical protein